MLFLFSPLHQVLLLILLTWEWVHFAAPAWVVPLVEVIVSSLLAGELACVPHRSLGVEGHHISRSLTLVGRLVEVKPFIHLLCGVGLDLIRRALV